MEAPDKVIDSPIFVLFSFRFWLVLFKLLLSLVLRFRLFSTNVSSFEIDEGLNGFGTHVGINAAASVCSFK